MLFTEREANASYKIYAKFRRTLRSPSICRICCIVFWTESEWLTVSGTWIMMPTYLCTVNRKIIWGQSGVTCGTSIPRTRFYILSEIRYFFSFSWNVRSAIVGFFFFRFCVGSSSIRAAIPNYFLVSMMKRVHNTRNTCAMCIRIYCKKSYPSDGIG